MRTTGSLTVRALGPDLPPGTDLAAVVDAVPGVTVRRLGGLGAFSAVSVRGSTFRQVEVFLDGVPMNPDGSGAVDLSELPQGLGKTLDQKREILIPLNEFKSVVGHSSPRVGCHTSRSGETVKRARILSSTTINAVLCRGRAPFTRHSASRGYRTNIDTYPRERCEAE
jgi:hypothetical protein